MKAWINDQQVDFSENDTILQMARKTGHFIPTLCELEEICHTPATCRVCLVEIIEKGSTEPLLVTACNTPIEDGMKIFTRTPEVRRRQRLQVELLFASHNQDCAVCSRHGDCELQDVARYVGLNTNRYNNPDFHVGHVCDDSSPAIVRDMDKCVLCKRCVHVCREYQGVDALVVTKTALDTEIAFRDDLPQPLSDCISCGQCVLVCPVGALSEKDDTDRALSYLDDPEIITLFQIAPAVRVALGEEFNMEAGTNVEGKLIAGLKQLGADIVVDTNFTADVVIMEEGTELLHRLNNDETLPLFTSCCPGWVSFVEKNYPEMRDNLSTTRSPQQCLGSLAKTYLADKMEIPKEKMRVISIMPCTAKKEEAARPEFEKDGIKDVDAVLTTREIANLFRREGVDMPNLIDATYDNPWMGDYSGAGIIFGTTGGVMEAALRTVYKVTTGEELASVDYEPVRGNEAIREANVELPGITVKVAIVHGLKAARKVMDEIKEGKRDYHFMEVMSCSGGCMEGGGQPKKPKAWHPNAEERKATLYAIDKMKTIRQSHNNPLVTKLYDEYLEKPNSHKAHELLHTTYRDRSKYIKQNMLKIWQEISISGVCKL
ncbi:MAG: [FeFe] hydrogenase, group A [Desulfovibrio sp.]